MSDDVKLATDSQQEAQKAAERAREELEEIEQMAVERAARKMMETVKGADVEPKNLISEEDLSVLKI